MQNEENKNIFILDQQADDLIGLIEHISPNTVTHDGSSAARQYYENIKKRKGRAVAIGALKVIIMNYHKFKESIEKELIKPIEEQICPKKKKSRKEPSAQ